MSANLKRARRATPRQSYPSVAAWREAHELGQRDAARVLGLSQSKYSRLERGQVRPVEDELKRIHFVTAVPVDVLVGLSS